MTERRKVSIAASKAEDAIHKATNSGSVKITDLKLGHVLSDIIYDALFTLHHQALDSVRTVHTAALYEIDDITYGRK